MADEPATRRRKEEDRVGWNYRLMRHLPDTARGEEETWYAIHEVFYKDDSLDDRSADSSEIGYTQAPIAPIASNVSKLRWVLEQMLAALDKPVLEYREDPNNEADAATDPANE